MVNLELLRKFLVVCKHNNLTSAAYELCITQPALTKAMKELESSLHTELFKRTSKGLKLTTNGEILKQKIELPLLQIEKTISLFEETETFHHKLTIGTSLTIAKNYLPLKLAKLQQVYPKLKIELISVSLNNKENNGIELLQSGDIDLIVSNQKLNLSNCICTPVHKIHDILICGEKYKALCHKNIDFKDVLEFPLILNSKGSVTRESFDKFCLENNYTPKINIEVSNNAFLVEMIKLNMGIGYSTREFITDEIDRNLLYEIKTNATLPVRNLYITYKKSNNLPELSILETILKS